MKGIDGVLNNIAVGLLNYLKIDVSSNCAKINGLNILSNHFRNFKILINQYIGMHRSSELCILNWHIHQFKKCFTQSQENISEKRKT